jgi:hypothetical protein
MKNYILATLLVSTAVLMFAFRTKEQEPNKSTYATVVYSTGYKAINIYYGAAKTFETIEFRRGENFQDKIMDALNELGKQDYVLISSSTNVINSDKGYNLTEFYYTLVKK